jgi:hypothetical protein
MSKSPSSRLNGFLVCKECPVSAFYSSRCWGSSAKSELPLPVRESSLLYVAGYHECGSKQHHPVRAEKFRFWKVSHLSKEDAENAEKKSFPLSASSAISAVERKAFKLREYNVKKTAAWVIMILSTAL